MSALRCHVRKLRQEAGLQQQELAARVGVSRQTLSAIEAGTTVPSTALALELARVLGSRVETLFALAGSDRPVPVTLAPGLGAPPGPTIASGSRVRLGQVRGRWLAHSLAGDNPSVVGTPADGIVTRRGRGGASVRPLRDDEALRANLLVSGCDPALGLLAGHLLEGAARLRLHWIEAASGPALEALARGQVHVAGIHLIDAATGEHNVPAVKARLGGEPIVVVNLAAWEQGLVVRAAQARKLRRAADLGAPGVRLIAREPGSGARALLDRILAEADLALADLQVTGTAFGHHAVARAVAAGEADAGIATAEAAAAHGLSFVPLAEDRFDLVLFADTLVGASGQRLMETLAGGRFRRDVGALAGYGTAQTGQIMARLAA